MLLLTHAQTGIKTCEKLHRIFNCGAQMCSKRKTMGLRRLDIYRDANEYFTPLRYLGLSIYSLPKPGQMQQLTISKINIIIVVVSLLTVALTLFGCNLYCISGRNNNVDSAFGMIIYIGLDLEIVGVVINAHLQSSRIDEIFKKFRSIDRKLLKLTDSKILIVNEQKFVKLIARVRCGLPVLIVVLDAVLLYKVIDGEVPVKLILCLIIPHFTNIWRSQSASLYTFFVNECTARVKYINSTIEIMLLLKQRIPCIETRIAPKANVCYKLEDAKHLMSIILDLVTEINKAFQFHLLIKIAHISAVLLLITYYAANRYYINRHINVAKEFIYYLYYTGHGLVQISDLLIDIWFYKELQKEVSNHVLYIYNVITILLGRFNHRTF